MSESVSVMSPPAPRKWLAPIAAAVAIVLAMGAAATGAAHWLLSADVLDKDVAVQIRRTTGFATTIEGHTRFHLFPQPRIEIENITFSDTAGAVRIDAGVLHAYLRILPLLVGRIEVGHAMLYRPNIFIALDRKPIVPESAIGRFAMSNPASPQAAMLLGRIDIVDGRAHLATHQKQTTELDDINMSLDWPSAYASAVLSGQATLHGTPISIEAWLSQPIELLRGGQSATILRLRSDVLALSTSGRVSAARRVQYIGRISADAASLRKLAEVAGYSFPRRGTFADLDMRGDLDFETDSAALTNLHMSLDGNDYEGNLAVEEENGLPRFSATLASDLLDVTPFLTGAPRPKGTNVLWNQQAPDLSDLRFADVDLRISASRLRLYDMQIEDAALSLMTKPGLIDLALAEATANHGIVKGRVSLAANGRNLDLQVIGSGKDVDIEPMALGLDGKRPLSGSLNASLALESAGADLGHLIRGLGGRAELSVTSGELKGIDLAATLRQSGAKSPGDPIKRADGTTEFDRLTMDLHLANGIAQIEQGQFSAAGMQLNFAGTADLAQRQLDLSALGQTTASGNRRTVSTPLRLRLKGSWNDLHFFQGEPDLRLPPAPQNAGDLPDPATSSPPPE